MSFQKSLDAIIDQIRLDRPLSDDFFTFLRDQVLAIEPVHALDRDVFPPEVADAAADLVRCIKQENWASALRKTEDAMNTPLGQHPDLFGLTAMANARINNNGTTWNATTSILRSPRNALAYMAMAKATWSFRVSTGRKWLELAKFVGMHFPEHTHAVLQTHFNYISEKGTPIIAIRGIQSARIISLAVCLLSSDFGLIS